MSRSEEFSRAVYATLGADGLAQRTRPEWDAKIVEALIEMLPPKGRVLDVGCGYGRIALPLARAGYDVVGIDISEHLLDVARTTADAEGLQIEFTCCSMTSLPYSPESYDAAICLWSAFYELLDPEEQTRAISELWRVIRVPGIALVEGPPYREPSDEEIERGGRRGPEQRIAWDVLEGIPNPHYAHDECSFRRRCEAAGVERFRVFEREWGGRERLFLRLDKVSA